MKVLYVTVPDALDAQVVLGDLIWLEPALHVETVTGAAAALAEIRTVGGYSAVFVSPALPQNEALALIASLRRDRTPIAIIVVIAEDQRAFFAPAVTAGADDVLVLRGERLLSVEDTIQRIRRNRHTPPGDGQPPLRVLYAGRDEMALGILREAAFLHVEQVAAEPDGGCPLTLSGPQHDGARAEAVVVDEDPGEAHSLQVVKWIRSHDAEVPVVVLTAPTAGDVGGAALELGADEVVSKAGPYRRRLLATLHRLFLRRLANSALPPGAGPAATVSARPAEPFVAPALPETPAPEARWVEERAALQQEVDRRAAAEHDTAQQIAALTAALETERAARLRAEAAARELAERDADEAGTAAALEALRLEHDRLLEAQAFERALRARDRELLAEQARALQEERERAAVLERTLRQTEDRAAAHAGSEALLAALRIDYDHLREAQAVLQAELDRERSALAAATQALDDERARAAAYERTLRQAEDRAAGFERRLNQAEDRAAALERALQEARARAAADRADAEARAADARRDFEVRLADAADRLHAVTMATQELQARLEQELSARTAARDRLADSALVAVAEFDEPGRLIRCNDSFARLLGYPDAERLREAAGDTPFAGLPDHATIVAALRDGAVIARVESTLRGADGRPCRVLTSARLVGDATGKDAIVERAFLDLSDRVTLEQELRLARRLESAGRLAAEMAPLIDAALSAARATVPAPDPDALGQADALVRQLLAYARYQARPAGFLSLNDAIERARELLGRVAGDTVALAIRAGGVEPVVASEDDIEALLIDAVRAAAACLPAGGTIAIETAPVMAPSCALRTQLSVVATGYGVLPLTLPPSLVRLAARLGGDVRTTGDAGRTSGLLVDLPC